MKNNSTKIKKGQHLSPQTQFKKGDTPWITGKKHSPESRLKMSRAHKGRRVSPATEFKKGLKHSPETLQKLSEYQLGEKHWNWSGGYPKCLDCSVVLSSYVAKRCHKCWVVYNRGDKIYNWKGGVRTEHQKIRGSIEYKIWRTAVFKRDDYRCMDCGERGGQLNADHILPFAHFPRLRFDINNGQTLCVDCHKKTPTYAHKAKNYQLTN